MRKRQNLLPNNIRDRTSLYSVWLAQEGEPGLLIMRLRQGKASKPEMAVAADLIEKNVKLRRRRKFLAEQFSMATFADVLKKTHPKWSRKQIIGEVSDHYRVKKSHVYKVLNDFDDETIAQILQLPPEIPRK